MTDTQETVSDHIGERLLAAEKKFAEEQRARWEAEQERFMREFVLERNREAARQFLEAVGSRIWKW